MNNNQRRATLTLGAVAGGLLAAAFLPMAVAFADEYDFTPDTTTFDPTQVEGYPPLDNVVTGTEDWNLYDLTTSTVYGPDYLHGVDTVTTIGSFTNDDFLQGTDFPLTIVSNSGQEIALPGDAQIDLANFGGGWENEWIDVPSSGDPSGISDLLITPFGDFQLFGSFFSDLSTVIAGLI
jgi:hypothetical protein